MRVCPTCQRTYPDDMDFCPRDATALVPATTATEAELEATLARRFRIVRRLGSGGMGTVFLAEQIAVGNRPVALKILLRKLLDDAEFLVRFRNEGASTGRIHHPNVVTIYESGQADDGTPYIAMEYLEGETLRQAVRERGALPVEECAAILQQVARGLVAAHKLGIIHRDLKPDNIFLTCGDEDELVVKVVDFGIAKLRESATHTLTGTVLGTPAYMSFEQVSGMRSDELDARSDIYSLGVVAYEMVTGRVPFHSDTPLGCVRKHLSEEPPPFRAVRPDLSATPRVERAVMKALTKDREARYSSALEFAREFGEAARTPLVSRKVLTPPVVGSAAGGEPRAYREEAGVAVKTPTPLPLPPKRIAKPPVSPQPTPAQVPSRPAALQAVARTPQLTTSPQPRRKTMYVVAGVLVLAAVGVWYLSQPKTKQAPPMETQRPAEVAGAGSAPSGMVSISGGTFMMGRDTADEPQEAPAHSVTVGPFYLDKTPSTVAQYSGAGVVVNDSSPATGVSWEKAQAFCESRGARLPTEAEWEFAARGTDGRLYPWGNNFAASLTNSEESGLGRPEPVGSHPDAASPFGVLDMSGNVWQWTADDYKPYPGQRAAFKIPAGAKVMRGGSYKFGRNYVTTTARNLDLPNKRSPEIGFRCAK